MHFLESVLRPVVVLVFTFASSTVARPAITARADAAKGPKVELTHIDAPAFGSWESDIRACGNCSFYLVSGPTWPTYGTHRFETFALGGDADRTSGPRGDSVHDPDQPLSHESADEPDLGWGGLIEEGDAHFERLYGGRFDCQGDGGGCHTHFAPDGCLGNHSSTCSGVSMAPDQLMRALVAVSQDDRVSALGRVFSSARATIVGGFLRVEDCKGQVSAFVPLSSELLEVASQLLPKQG